MNILFLEDSSQSSYGGGQKISKIVIESLVREHLIFLSDYSQTSLFFNDVKLLLEGRIKLASKFYSNKYLNRLFQILLLPKNIYYLKSCINKKKISLIYATTKLTLLTAFILHKITKVNYVYHSHMAFDVNIQDKIFSFFLKDAVLVLAVSEYVKDSILTYYKSIKILVLYNPIEFEVGLPKSIINKNNINIAFLGTIKKEKGVDVLMNVANICSIKHPMIKFLFFGNGIMINSLKKNKTDNVELYGHVSDVEFYLDQHVHIVLLPSIIPEACPTVILQAISKGIPIITTNIGGQNELIKNHINGFVVPINDPMAIIEKIDFIISNPHIYSQISLNNLKKANLFNNVLQFEIEILNLFNSFDEDTSIR